MDFFERTVLLDTNMTNDSEMRYGLVIRLHALAFRLQTNYLSGIKWYQQAKCLRNNKKVTEISSMQSQGRIEPLHHRSRSRHG